MKKLCAKISILAVIVAVAMFVLEILSYDENYSIPIAKLTDSEYYLNHLDGPNWIVPLINRVQEKNDSTVLLIGSSVARQMFEDLVEYNEKVCIAPAIAPFTLCGQYLLTELYLDNHPNATDVFLMMMPEEYDDCALSRGYGYQYIVMPLVETDTLSYLTEDTIDDLRKVYGERFLDPDIVRKVDKSGLNRKLYLNYIKNQSTTEELSETSSERFRTYMGKIVSLCNERNVTLHILPSPLMDCEENRRIAEEELPAKIAEGEFADAFSEYFEYVRFYPEEMFEDGTHFGYPYNNQTFYNTIIEEMYGDIEELELKM